HRRVGERRIGSEQRDHRDGGQCASGEAGEAPKRPGQPHSPCSLLVALPAVDFGMTGASSSPIRRPGSGVAGIVPERDSRGMCVIPKWDERSLFERAVRHPPNPPEFIPGGCVTLTLEGVPTAPPELQAAARRFEAVWPQWYVRFSVDRAPFRMTNLPAKLRHSPAYLTAETFIDVRAVRHD